MIKIIFALTFLTMFSDPHTFISKRFIIGKWRITNTAILMTSSADDKKQLLLNCQNQEIEFKRDSAYFFSKTCQLFTKEHLIIEKEIKNYTKDSIDNLFSTMLSYYLYKDGEKDITVLKTNIHVDELPNEYWWIFIINRNKVFLLQYPNLYELERK